MVSMELSIVTCIGLFDFTAVKNHPGDNFEVEKETRDDVESVD